MAFPLGISTSQSLSEWLNQEQKFSSVSMSAGCNFNLEPVSEVLTIRGIPTSRLNRLVIHRNHCFTTILGLENRLHISISQNLLPSRFFYRYILRALCCQGILQHLYGLLVNIVSFTWKVLTNSLYTALMSSSL